MGTRLTRAAAAVPYKAFGTLLADLRRKAGISHQSELAKLVKSTQQTISRWEAGISRPRDTQMALLASVLKADIGQMLSAARYTAKVAAASFDQPFPVDALNPPTFERFCLYFLSALYHGSEVHPAGGQGHAQEGLDIEVTFADGKRHTFQCKRVEEFGPQKVHTAVAAHSGKAAKKFLLLSRTASLHARTAIRQHKGWDIWDKEDISLKIRQLPKDEQIRLVDTFFRGQRLALLGETEPGPWQTREEFFRPFEGQGAFSHAWRLVGRSRETDQLLTSLSQQDTRIVFLVGAGGSGKSRVLKQAIEEFESKNKQSLVRFLSPSESVSRKSLEDLGDREKLLVVDDAHDRDGLQPLFQYAATTDNVTLLVSLRGYGLDYIKAQASKFALAGNCVHELRLAPLTLDDAAGLAHQVLRAFSGPIESAKDIARLTLDCPLATVVGAQVVAKDKVHFEFARNESTFRSTLMGRFRDIIAGDIGQKSDAEPIRKLLRILAILQPFDPQDKALLHLAEQVDHLDGHQVNRYIRLLTDAGVLFKRGGAFRLSPDLLADFIIEKECIGHEGRSTGYAERVFEAASDSQIERILVNLGKLDWRRANGDPSNSRLLDGIWAQLNPSKQYRDPHIGAVAAVAFYQPSRALDFVQRLLRTGEYLQELPRILKYIGFNFDYLRPVCECLWAVGKGDVRSLGQTPNHAIRILAELCAVEPNKPIEYNAVVVDFALSLLPRPNAWTTRYSPFDIIAGILQPEGHTTSSNGRSVSWSRFQVNPGAVAALRTKVVDASVKLLSDSNIRAAALAAHALQAALRYPMDGTQESRNEWTKEFLQTLKKIAHAIKKDRIGPFVLIEIARSVSWHAHYAPGATSVPAKKIIASLPSSLRFRTMLALTNGYGHPLARIGDDEKAAEWEKELAAVVIELSSAYPDPEARRLFVEYTLSHIEANAAERAGSPYHFYRMLVDSAPEFALATIENALANPASNTGRFAAMTLAKLLNENHSEGYRIAERFLASGREDLLSAIGIAYSGFNFKEARYGDEDIGILRVILASDSEQVGVSAIAALRAVARADQRLAVDLLHELNLGISSKLADDALMLFYSDGVIPFQFLNEEDIKRLLDRLEKLPALYGHWVETFLGNVSKHHARLGVQFFMARVEFAATARDWSFRACNHGPYSHVPLRFREAPEFPSLLREAALWTRSRDDYYFQHYAAQLFDTMFQPLDATLVSFLQEWLDVAGPEDISVISQIIRHSAPNCVIDHAPFSIRLLETAKTFGMETLDAVLSELYAGAVSGMRSGTFGEPFPQDISLKAEAESLLRDIPRLSPAYQLYESIRDHADGNIKQSLREAEALEEFSGAISP